MNGKKLIKLCNNDEFDRKTEEPLQETKSQMWCMSGWGVGEQCESDTDARIFFFIFHSFKSTKYRDIRYIIKQTLFTSAIF